MAKGIEIGVASETKAFKQGIVTGVIQPLEDAQQALEDLADGKSPEQLERQLKDAARATENLKDETKDAARGIEQEFRDAYRSVKRSSDEGVRGARRGMSDLKSESKQTARESAASFDGSAASIADAFQEVAANAFIGFGPAGLAAGFAAAAGIGLISSALQKGDADAEALKQRVAELTASLTAELINMGTEAGPSLEYVVNNLEQLATAAGDGEVNLKAIRKVADGSKSSFKDLAQAYAGNTDRLDELVDAGKEHEATLKRQANLASESIQLQQTTYSGLQQQLLAQQDYNKYLAEAKTAADEAAAAEANWIAAGGPELKRKADLIATIDEAYDDAAASVDDYIDAESGIFDVTRYITAMEARRQALNDYQKDLAEAELSEEAKGFLNAQGADAAAQFLAGYKAATPEQKNQLNALWTENAKENSATYVAALTSSITGQTIVGPTVTLNTDQASQQLTDLFKNPVPITVKIKNTDAFFGAYKVGVKVP